MNKSLQKFILAILSCTFFSYNIYGQTDSTSSTVDSSSTATMTNELLDLSIEDLMDLKIVSASRSEESAFQAPLSSYVISKKDIQNSGATLIPEALRLCPGLIVRESYNGSYSVAIRGFENIPTHQYLNSVKTILVMIDNRPVFDYLNGGTFWQNLPIDIMDVERIEVVYGPSSPLYGPNAVNGVINIITRKPQFDGLYSTVSGFAGNANTSNGAISIGYKKNKFDVILSSHYHWRDRFIEEYYGARQDTYYDAFDSLSVSGGNPNALDLFHPLGKVSLYKAGANIFTNYNISNTKSISVQTGMNNAYYIYPTAAYSSNSVIQNTSYYGMVKANLNDFSFQSSILNGKQGLVGDVEEYFYNYTNFDGYVDYNLKVSEQFSIRPAVNYQQAFVNDLEYTVDKNLVGLFNNNKSMYNIGGSIKADYKTNKYRLIGAVRADKFLYPQKIYPSYQLIGNYFINEKNNVRAVVSRSNTGSFMTDTYANFITQEVEPTPAFPIKQIFYYKGSEKRDLPVGFNTELGYRSQLSDNVQLDISVFRTKMSGFTRDVFQLPDTSQMSQGILTTNIKVSNIDVTATQLGSSVSLNILMLNNKLNFKPTFTVQSTQLNDYAQAFWIFIFNTEDNITKQKDIEHEATPSWYGSFYLNYNPIQKLNINLNGYMYDANAIRTLSEANLTGFPLVIENKAAANIPTNFLLNAKVSYEVVSRLKVFANVRNILNTRNNQDFGSDKIGALYLGGLSLDY